MTVLVTGAGGQLGWDVCRTLERRGVPYAAPARGEMDLTDPGQVMETVGRVRPDAVIHCGAWTGVDAAEEAREAAFAVNGGGTRNVAMACREVGAKMLYTSTDYVFPGTGTRPYEPDDPPGPVNVYGESKLAGERAVEELLERYFIVRISWVFGKHGNNFVKTMLRLAESGREIRVVHDQVGSPTYTADLAPLLCDMVETEKYGIYHAANEGFCSWAEFAEEIFRQSGQDVAVRRLTTEEYPVRARRPLNSRLGKGKLAENGFAPLPEWRDGLRRYLAELKE